MNLDISELRLSLRLYKILEREGLRTVGDIYSEENVYELPEFNGLGSRSYRELNEKLTAAGYPPLPKVTF